jgi:hypothetical protein
MATGIRRELPWLKLILSLREPISHEISVRERGLCRLMMRLEVWHCLLVARLPEILDWAYCQNGPTRMGIKPTV